MSTSCKKPPLCTVPKRKLQKLNSWINRKMLGYVQVGGWYRIRHRKKKWNQLNCHRMGPISYLLRWQKMKLLLPQLNYNCWRDTSRRSLSSRRNLSSKISDSGHQSTIAKAFQFRSVLPGDMMLVILSTKFQIRRSTALLPCINCACGIKMSLCSATMGRMRELTQILPHS
jgi:hypothetical protein